MRIGIDLMGSESSPFILFEAVLDAAKLFDHIIFVVFANQATLDVIHTLPQFLQLSVLASKRIEFFLVADVIEMEDEPLLAIRQKKNSSLSIGVGLLKKGEIAAFISAGNTGALIACATLFLPLLPKIKRPALLATLPTAKGDVAIIDVGGHVYCKATHLVQFAQMGAAYQICMQGIASPRIGLLNIGVESKKGTLEVQQAYQILQEQMPSSKLKMEFIGNIEGREVFQGKVDVLVTDGFTGNVLLKTSEGVSFFILDHLQFALQEVRPENKAEILSYLRHHFDYEEYTGAIVCGIDGIIVKCHGKTTAKGMFNSIQGAIHLIKNGFLYQIKQLLQA